MVADSVLSRASGSGDQLAIDFMRGGYFNWLPSHLFSGIDLASIQDLGRGLQPFLRHVNAFSMKFSGRYKGPPPFIGFQRRIIEVGIIVMRLRRAFRTLVHYWLWRKAQRSPLPDNDIITMMPYKRPIIIYDMLQRRRYKFEAATIVEHICKQLEYVSYGFVQPLWPRNPITNLPFSSGQLYVIYKEALKYGCAHSTFCAFFEVRFSMMAFYNIYNSAIATNYNITNVRHVKNTEGHEILTEFIIECANDEATILHPKILETFEWAIETIPEHPYLKAWRSAFYIDTYCEGADVKNKVTINGLLATINIAFRDFLKLKIKCGSSGSSSSGHE